jgi:hypothetical protein
MSTFWTKITHLTTSLKKLCIEQLWLFALLTPLIMLAVLGAMHWRASASKNTHKEAELLVEIMVSTEITSAEVALIVAKPIGELLEMQVYFADKSSRRRGELLAELTVDDMFRNGASNQILVYSHRRDTSQVLTYSEQINYKKYQKMAEQS